MESAKIDLYKVHAADYVTPKKPVLLKIPKAQYLAIAGQGAPGGAAFQDAIGALMAVAYTMKMTSKFEAGRDYGVAKLEGQWWVEDGACFNQESKDKWFWNLLIRTPDFIGKKDLSATHAKLIAKGKPALVKQVALFPLAEGKCVQMLHVGPYDREGESIALMLAYAKEQGFDFHGRHHEIYLSDPRRAEPAKLRTILRMPIKKQ
jgi:hypothetical protein